MSPPSPASERLVLALPEGELEIELRLPPAAPLLVLCPGLGARAAGAGPGWPAPDGALDGLLAVADVPLLTPWEETLDRFSGRFRFDIEMLARRLAEAAAALRADPRGAGLPFGLFARGTSAAAALLAAAREPELFVAVVSWEGRADLIRPWLPAVRVPTLLLVDGDDGPVLDLTLGALELLGAPAEVRVLPFAEGGERRLAPLAAAWFRAHLPATA